jgi:hypothetical protein
VRATFEIASFTVTSREAMAASSKPADRRV